MASQGLKLKPSCVAISGPSLNADEDDSDQTEKLQQVESFLKLANGASA